MAAKYRNKMQTKQPKVRKIKSKSREDRKKEAVRKEKKKQKIQQSKQVPMLLIEFDKVYHDNLKAWLSNFSEGALTKMVCKEVDFVMLLAKIGPLDKKFIKVIENWPSELAQKCDADILPTNKPDKTPELIWDDKLLREKTWLDLLKFLLQEDYEKMCVSHVERALELLNLGLAKYVHPTIKEKHKIPDGDLHEGIRRKLLLQKQVAEAKKAEKAKKKKENQAALNEYKGHLDHIITWERDYRNIAYTGLVVSDEPKTIFAPFSLSESELKFLLEKATKKASGTSLSVMNAAALYLYTGNSYAILNRDLRTIGNEHKLPAYAHFLIHLSNALGNLNALQGEERIVHRGTKFFELNLEVGQKLVFQAPTSASKSKDVANGFMEWKGLHFAIETLTGKSIESFSCFPEEEEVLLPPNSCFEVKQITSGQEEIAKVLPGLTEHKRQRIRTMVVLKQYA